MNTRVMEIKKRDLSLEEYLNNIKPYLRNTLGTPLNNSMSTELIKHYFLTPFWSENIVIFYEASNEGNTIKTTNFE